jgi:predicted RNA-binding protein with PUA-like domain
MRRGDEALIYHTGKEKALAGIAMIASNPYPDPRAGDPRIVVVDIRPSRKLGKPLPLAEIKADRSFASFDLVRNSRLSVMPVHADLWSKILSMSR